MYEVLAIQSFGSTSSFTLRGFRIVRLLQPLSQIGIFSDLETIFHAIGAALIPMATVLLFIWFVLILFGIMGIAQEKLASIIPLVNCGSLLRE